MEPVIFKPEDTESNPRAAGPADLSVPDADTFQDQNLPSLAIPVGTTGKRPKSFAVKAFIKAFVLTYLTVAAAGIAVVRMSV